MSVNSRTLNAFKWAARIIIVVSIKQFYCLAKFNDVHAKISRKILQCARSRSALLQLKIASARLSAT